MDTINSENLYKTEFAESEAKFFIVELKNRNFTLESYMFRFPLFFILLYFISFGVQAEEYLLKFKSKCTSIGNELSYDCKEATDPNYYIAQEDNSWVARYEDGTFAAAFRTLRNDENILILEQSTVYSGNQTVHIFKLNNRFYLVQVAYSSIIKDNETTTKQGIFIRTER